ncbi:MAG TPA: hypothetical protein VLQ45_25180 [Thermoanaerobaculia bacterium]|nr:hypothetical protein [Thermoanaerobaculia bacterium]
MVFVLTATAWASGQWVSDWDEATATGVSPVPVASTPADLEAPLTERPSEIFVQKTSAFGDRGNVLVSLQLTPDQVAAKQADGTADFITIGDLSHQVILRDDGDGGDGRAGDGLFTGLATVDVNDLAARASADSAAIAGRSGSTTVPVFQDRAVVGTATPQAFDYAGFNAGAAVRLEPAVAFVEPESGTTQQSQNPVSEASSSGDLVSASAAAVVLGTNVFQERVLMIRSLGVVTDPTRTYNPCNNSGNNSGVWTFNRVMTEMANPAASGIDPAVFAENWLKHWASTQVINADTVPARTQINQLIARWKTDSGGVKLDLKKSPLRLLAIVPRVDLRRTTGGGGSYSSNLSGKFLDAGEMRFIFGVVLKPGWSGTGFVGPVQIPGQAAGCRALPFSVIVEYKVPKCECKGVKDWAARWVDLKNYVPGTTAYNTRLQRLTEEIVRANGDPRQPNGSNLGQLRTNEVALPPATTPYGQPGGPQWELREFQLTQFPFTFLAETTVADTPEDAYNNNLNLTGLLLNWILNAIPNGPPPVPLFFGGKNFLAGNSIIPDAPAAVPVHHWNAPGLNLALPAHNNARFQVSLAACNSCHRGETGTHFVHVDPSNSIPGSTGALPAALSGFLTGITWNDPAHGAPAREFDDLARREIDIQQVAGLSCLRFHTVNVAAVQDSLATTGRLPSDLFSGMPVTPFELRVPIGVDDLRRSEVKQVH